ncbi:MAG: hypothetical protein GF344_06895, partial [Chitinivibrionales bacterium]|nr:hypothetical protein [Chitinivibrionales bacterium]MBD3356647.1 hypothetical protein [Chitinivibrionales bacterium]
MQVTFSAKPLSDNYRDQTATQPKFSSSPLNYPRFDQGDTNACGTTSLAMIMCGLGKEYSPAEIDARIRRFDTGTSVQNMIDFARGNGLSAECYNGASLSEIKHHLAAGRGVQVLLDTAEASAVADHYAVVTGFSTNRKGNELIHLIDPDGGKDVTMSTDEFMERWQSRVGDVDRFATVYGAKGDMLPPGRKGNAAEELAVMDFVNDSGNHGNVISERRLAQILADQYTEVEAASLTQYLYAGRASDTSESVDESLSASQLDSKDFVRTKEFQNGPLRRMIKKAFKNILERKGDGDEIDRWVKNTKNYLEGNPAATAKDIADFLAESFHKSDEYAHSAAFQEDPLHTMVRKSIKNIMGRKPESGEVGKLVNEAKSFLDKNENANTKDVSEFLVNALSKSEELVQSDAFQGDQLRSMIRKGFKNILGKKAATREVDHWVQQTKRFIYKNKSANIDDVADFLVGSLRKSSEYAHSDAFQAEPLHTMVRKSIKSILDRKPESGEVGKFVDQTKRYLDKHENAGIKDVSDFLVGSLSKSAEYAHSDAFQADPLGTMVRKGIKNILGRKPEDGEVSKLVTQAKRYLDKQENAGVKDVSDFLVGSLYGGGEYAHSDAFKGDPLKSMVAETFERVMGHEATDGEILQWTEYAKLHLHTNSEATIRDIYDHLIGSMNGNAAYAHSTLFAAGPLRDMMHAGFEHFHNKRGSAAEIDQFYMRVREFLN